DQLGSTSFREREQASRELVTAGWPALSALRRAAEAADAETARRARECLDKIALPRWEPVGAAVRLLLRRHPAGAVAALLAYLPYAVEEEAAEDIWFGLDALTVRSG